MKSIAQIIDEAANPDAEGLYIGGDLHSDTCPCEPCAKENARFADPLPPLSEKETDERATSFEAFKAECADRVDAREWAEGLAGRV